jgi:plasmid stabilization system protein ParE
MKLRLTVRALQDLDSISEYIRAQNPQAAERVGNAIWHSLRALETYPYLGRRQTLAKVRRQVTRRYPYLIYYQIDLAAGEVIVLSVRHAAQQRDFEDR